MGKKKDEYAHLELLYEPVFESLRTVKRYNSRLGRGLVCQAIWFSYLFILGAVSKVGRLFVNQIIAVALIRERRLFE